MTDWLTTPVDLESRRGRARVPLTTPPGLFGRFMSRYSRRTYGEVLDVGLALGHHRPALMADLMFERRVAKWNKLDPELKFLAVMAASIQVECSWCIDFGYYEAHQQGVAPAKLAAVSGWRTSERFSPIERDVLEYAEAVTATPPTVTDDLSRRLRDALGVPGLIELTMMVAVENLRSRVNASLGLASQGFSESCRVPSAPRPGGGS